MKLVSSNSLKHSSCLCRSKYKILIALIFGVVISACDSGDQIADPEVAGFIYTSTNGEATNQVLKLERYRDGRLGNEVAYTTNSRGGADRSRHGELKGRFDSQGAMRIIGDYLLVANAGGNTISVFFISKPTGDLTLLSNLNSGGARPVSLAFTQKADTSNSYWVVVANQWGNPNVQGVGTSIKRYPNDAFHSDDLSNGDVSDGQRNISLFSFNASDGSLNFERLLDTYVRENGGPTSVEFNDAGTKLAVSTWGVAHIAGGFASSNEQKPSRVYVYDYENGSLSGERFFEEEGIAGSVGLRWARSSDKLHVSNSNLIPAKRDNGHIVLSDNSGAVVKIQNEKTNGTETAGESGWNIIAPGGEKIYVASAISNYISVFSLNANGEIVAEESGVKLLGSNSLGDSKELYVSADNRYLYNLSAFSSYAVGRLAVSNTGLSFLDDTSFITTSPSIGNAGTYNFLGLVGYDLEVPEE